MTALRTLALAYGLLLGLVLFTGHWWLAGAMILVPGLVFVGACIGLYLVLTREGQL